ncbi:FadR/GntR family transcriptional regulator [Streptomyces sp. NPDC005774]|uniref:FadR/GntR family transcriptional regulator n=1 Tax=Streptomyces sp. NPDC005774 TaxID=3364728 RepID=UPI0036AF1F97
MLRHVDRGTFIAPNETARPKTSGHQPSPAEIMASRLVLEPNLTPLAVASATGADLEEMERCLHGGEQASSSEEFERWYAALHHSFAVATHNTVLISTSSMLLDTRHQPICGRLKRRSFSTERHRCHCTEHEQIVTAVRERDPQAARDTMREHLHHVRRVLLGNHF